jgi:predicted PurR-regulated permease PerM
MSQIGSNLYDGSSSSQINSLWSFTQRVLLIVGIVSAAVLLLLFLWQSLEVLLLVFTGILLAVLFRSLGNFVSKYTPLSEKWAVGVVLLALTAIIALGIWLTLPSIQQQLKDLSQQLPNSVEQMRKYVGQYAWGQWLLTQMPENPQLLGGSKSNLFGRITGFFSSFLGAVVNVLIVLVTAIYLAFNPTLYREGVVKLFPQSRHRRVEEVLDTLGFTLQRWIIGRTIVGVINGALTTLGLWYLGIPFAIPLGILAGLFNVVPNIGPILAGIPAVLIALPQGLNQVGYVVILYLIVQNFEGFVLSPLVQQRSISLPPVLVLAAQLLLGILFGFWGVLVAVPLVAVVFVLVKMIYVEDILGNKVEVKGEEQAKQNQSQTA